MERHSFFKNLPPLKKRKELCYYRFRAAGNELVPCDRAVTDGVSKYQNHDDDIGQSIQIWIPQRFGELSKKKIHVSDRRRGKNWVGESRLDLALPTSDWLSGASFLELSQSGVEHCQYKPSLPSTLNWKCSLCLWYEWSLWFLGFGFTSELKDIPSVRKNVPSSWQRFTAYTFANRSASRLVLTWWRHFYHWKLRWNKKVIVLMTRFANICVMYPIEHQFPRMSSSNPRSHQSENLREILETLQ